LAAVDASIAKNGKVKGMEIMTAAKQRLLEVIMTPYTYGERRIEEIESLIFGLLTEKDCLSLLQDALAFYTLPVTQKRSPIEDMPTMEPAMWQHFYKIVTAKMELKELNCCEPFRDGKSAPETAKAVYDQLQSVHKMLGREGRVVWLAVILGSAHEHVPVIDVDPSRNYGAWDAESSPDVLIENAGLFAELSVQLRKENMTTVSRWLARVPCTNEAREVLTFYAFSWQREFLLRVAGKRMDKREQELVAIFSRTIGFNPELQN
jgi:hypothetical protein